MPGSNACETGRPSWRLAVQLQKRETILQDDGTTLLDAVSFLRHRSWPQAIRRVDPWQLLCLAQHAPQNFGRWLLQQLRAFHNQRPQAIAVTGFLQPRGRRSFPTRGRRSFPTHVQGSDRSPAGETAVDRFLDMGVGLKTSAKKDVVSLPQTSRSAVWLCFALLCFVMFGFLVFQSLHAGGIRSHGCVQTPMLAYAISWTSGLVGTTCVVRRGLALPRVVRGGTSGRRWP